MILLAAGTLVGAARVDTLMGRIDIDGLDVVFPFQSCYPEQKEYMLELKRALDAKGPPQPPNPLAPASPRPASHPALPRRPLRAGDAYWDGKNWKSETKTCTSTELRHFLFLSLDHGVMGKRS